MMQSTIAVILPRGESLRNFLYSGILEELSKEYRIILFSVVPNASLGQLLSDKSDLLYEIKKTAKLRYLTRLAIELTDLAHNKHLWSEASKLRWELREAEARGTRVARNEEGLPLHSSQGRKYRSGWIHWGLLQFKKAIALVLAHPNRLQRMDNWLYRMAKSELCVKEYKLLLQAHKPALVFNSSHVHAMNAYPIMQAARMLGIKTASFLFSWDNLTSQGRIFPSADFYMCWNKKIKSQLLGIYPAIQPKQVYVTGTPQFVFHFNTQFHKSREQFLLELGLAPHQRYVLYSVGLSHNIPCEEVVAERIADMLAVIDPDTKLVIRTYAKDPTKVFEELAQRRPDIIVPTVQWEVMYQTPMPEDQQFYTNLLLHASVGVNVGSTVSLELAMFDKPVIYVGYDPPGRNISPMNYSRILKFDHLKPIINSGAVTVADSEANMQHWINRYLLDPACHAGERKKMIEWFFEISGEDNKLMSTQAFLQSVRQIVSGVEVFHGEVAMTGSVA